MVITIRKATEADFPAILSLIRELALFEKAPEKVTNTVAQMQQEKDLFGCYLAESDNNEILGMVLFFSVFIFIFLFSANAQQPEKQFLYLRW
jgi:predicted N-acetyltransferase YhbS